MAAYDGFIPYQNGAIILTSKSINELSFMLIYSSADIVSKTDVQNVMICIS